MLCGSERTHILQRPHLHIQMNATCEVKGTDENQQIMNNQLPMSIYSTPFPPRHAKTRQSQAPNRCSTVAIEVSTSVANSAVFPRNLASFTPVPRGVNLHFWGLLFMHTFFGLISKVVGFTSCVTLKAVIFYVS